MFDVCDTRVKQENGLSPYMTSFPLKARRLRYNETKLVTADAPYTNLLVTHFRVWHRNKVEKHYFNKHTGLEQRRPLAAKPKCAVLGGRHAAAEGGVGWQSRRETGKQLTYSSPHDFSEGGALRGTPLVGTARFYGWPACGGAGCTRQPHSDRSLTHRVRSGLSSARPLFMINAEFATRRKQDLRNGSKPGRLHSSSAPRLFNQTIFSHRYITYCHAAPWHQNMVPHTNAQQ